MEVLEKVVKWQVDRNLDKMAYRHNDEIANIIEEVCETYCLSRFDAQAMVDKIVFWNEGDTTADQKVDAYFDICVYAIGAMMKLGYDPIKVFNEGLKEINERTGAYDPKVGKWVKQPKKENAYKADFSKAKK